MERGNTLMMTCPICKENFKNEVELFDHYSLVKYVNKYVENDPHVIYLKEMYEHIEHHLKTNLSRKEIVKKLLDEGFIATENDVFEVEREKFLGRSLCQFYGIPYDKNLFEKDKTDPSIELERKEILKSIPKLMFLHGMAYKCWGGREGKDCSNPPTTFIPVDGNRDNYLISNIAELSCEEHSYVPLQRCNQTIMKEFTFDSSHHLLGYHGKCKYPHGHTYMLKVYIESPVRFDSDMVLDFGILKEKVKSTINLLDHRNINDILFDLNTTSENIILWIWVDLEKEKLKGISKLELSETPTSITILTKEQLLSDYLYLKYMKTRFLRKEDK